MSREGALTVPVHFLPGIQRDSTQFLSESAVDGQWVRWYDGNPRKMGGYRLLIPGTEEVIRTLFEVEQEFGTDVYLGRESGVYVCTVSTDLVAAGEINRTPITYSATAGNIWQFDSLTDVVAGSPPSIFSYIIAFVAPQDTNLLSNIPGQTYIGVTDDPTYPPLVAMDNAAFTGGIVCVPPFIIGYGAHGVMYYSDPDSNPPTFPDDNFAVVANTPKIIYIGPQRSDGPPTVLIWCIDQLVRAQFVSSDVGWSTTIIDDNISIISQRSVVIYNSEWYWIGQNQFYRYDGVVNRQMNTMSTDYFFNNINPQFSSRTYAFTNRRYGEIVWAYPSKNSLTGECDSEIIYNVDMQVYYDVSQLYRTSCYEASALLPFPLMADALTEPNPNIATSGPPIQTYPVWMHEYGWDKEIYGQSIAIQSYFRTKLFSLLNNNMDRNGVIMRFEPDFIMNDNNQMIVRLYLQAHPATEPFITDTYLFDNTTEKIDFSNIIRKGRIWSLYIESNQVGGFYQMGKPLMIIEIGNDRPEPTNQTD